MIIGVIFTKFCTWNPQLINTQRLFQIRVSGFLTFVEKILFFYIENSTLNEVKTVYFQTITLLIGFSIRHVNIPIRVTVPNTEIVPLSHQVNQIPYSTEGVIPIILIVHNPATILVHFKFSNL